MRDLDTLSYHGTADKLVDVLCQKTQSTNRLFFHILAGYYFAKVASMMRVNIKTHDRGKIPVNLYAINLASSGEGKGHSTNIIEDHVIGIFRERFLDETFPATSEIALNKLAVKRATKKAVDPDEELVRVQKEFDLLGNLAFSFDSGTTAAVKQMRHKLLMADAGSMNMEIDEIGSNLMGNVDVLTTFLELYDVGKVKQKLTKNTAENLRGEEIEGKTPTNMLLFGTPAKLLDGGRTEDEFFSMLETGYARRCLFGFAKGTTKETEFTPEEVYNMLTDNSSDLFLQTLSGSLGDLADPLNFNTSLNMDKDVSLLLIEYRMMCEKQANRLSDHEEIRKAEISHRYFKALKLAGTYAFIDGSPDVTEDHIYNAIALVEESGKSFSSLLTRDRNYVKLANYIANIGREVTHVDLVEELPFYKGSEAAKRELMALAIAYGYKNNIIIKKVITDGIEFLRGETLAKTDINAVTISYSGDLATGYRNETAPFDQLHKLTQADGMHWCAHHCLDGRRREDHIIQGFNLIALDIDSGVSLETARLLLKDHKFLIYTTKRHAADLHRFRIIMPMTHTLQMDVAEYKEFMANVFEWLPFDVDKQTIDRSRKWMSHNGHYEYNDGELIDSLMFIPKTSKNEERKKIISSQQSLNNMERWFLNNTAIGNRSNQMIRYALMLVDSGMDQESVHNNILALNSKLPDKMDEMEIMTTIMTSAAKAIVRRDSAA